MTAAIGTAAVMSELWPMGVKKIGKPTIPQHYKVAARLLVFLGPIFNPWLYSFRMDSARTFLNSKRKRFFVSGNFQYRIRIIATELQAWRWEINKPRLDKQICGNDNHKANYFYYININWCSLYSVLQLDDFLLAAWINLNFSSSLYSYNTIRGPGSINSPSG